jgi:hypothetical protein
MQPNTGAREEGWSLGKKARSLSAGENAAVEGLPTGTSGSS